MIQKGLLIALILIITGCAGTIRVAEENVVSSTDLTTPVISKGKVTTTKD